MDDDLSTIRDNLELLLTNTAEPNGQLDQQVIINVSTPFKKRMQEVAAAEGLDIPNLIRRAIGLYDLVQEEGRNGIYMAFVRLPDDERKQPEIITTFSL
jgi:hypothetical protein